MYVDDILIICANWGSHRQNLADMFSILHQNNLKCNASKCEFAFTELDFLGHTISADGIKISREKFKVINKILPPSNRKSL